MYFRASFRIAFILVLADVMYAKPPRRFSPEQLTGSDIVYRPSLRIAFKTANRWPNAEVPYVIEPELSAATVNAINRAIQAYNQLTCIRLVPKIDGHKSYIRFMDGGAGRCYSYIGRVGGVQDLSLGPGCETHGTVLHEIEHALGFDHEQNRPDRDDYVNVRFDQITPAYRSAFNKRQPLQVELRGLRYDYLSMMHYGRTFFSKNGEETIITLDKRYQHQIGQRTNFSQCDLEKINRHYNCNDYILSDNPCGEPAKTTSTITADATTDTVPAATQDTTTVESTNVPTVYSAVSVETTIPETVAVTTTGEPISVTTRTEESTSETVPATDTTTVVTTFTSTDKPTYAPAPCENEPTWNKWCKYYVNKMPQLCHKSQYVSLCKKSCNKCEWSNCRDNEERKELCQYSINYGYIKDYGCNSGRGMDQALREFCPKTCGLC